MGRERCIKCLRLGVEGVMERDSAVVARKTVWPWAGIVGSKALGLEEARL